MNVRIFLMSAIVILSVSAKAQETFCGQAEATNNWLSARPHLKQRYDEMQVLKTEYIHQNHNNTGSRSEPELYSVFVIPVVFHVLHINGIENISDSQIINQVEILNRDYLKQNADTNQVVPTFQNNIANVGFRFKLASIDPNGHCTNGIVRHYDSITTHWDGNSLDNFIYSWPTNKYLNIYVVKKINIATAYTFLPGIGIPDSADVIVCQHNMVGSIGTGNVAYSRVLTHEVAHWFDIQHIWGITNAPGVTCGDDLIDDTPVTKGFLSCNTANSNVCDPTISENVQNYMDYSPCKRMFTNGQKERMYATIASGVNRRDELFTEENLISTGVIGSLLCIALPNGVENLNDDVFKSIKVYPNPTQSSATVEFYASYSGKVEVEITDALGKLYEYVVMVVEKDKKAQYTLNKEGNLSANVYFVSIKNDNQKTSVSFVVSGN